MCMYSFVRLSEHYYKSSPWPEAEEVAMIVQNGEHCLRISFNFMNIFDIIIDLFTCFKTPWC